MHVGTRIKGAFGDYGLFFKPRQTGKTFEFLALNCSFLNTDPIFTKKLHFVPFLTHYSVIILFPYLNNTEIYLKQFHYINTEKIFVLQRCCLRAPPRRNRLDHNILVPTCTCLWVRKMHVGTRIKGEFGDYGLLYQTASTGKIGAEI